MKKNKKGFTLIEMVIVLLVISIIFVIGLSVFKKKRNLDGTLYKSAFKYMENIVDELASNYFLYPSGILDGTLCTNVLKQTNTAGTTDCTASQLSPEQPNFTTPNGMTWFGFNSTFTPTACIPSTTGNCIQIFVDIDGKNKGPNTQGADILKIIIYDTGRVEPPANSLESTYLLQ